MARQLFDARCFVLPDRAIFESPRSPGSLQGQSLRRTRHQPHRASTRQRAANFGSHRATSFRRWPPAIPPNRSLPRGPHLMITRCAMKFGRSWLVPLAALCSLLVLKSLVAQSAKNQNDSIPVKFTDIRKQAGITFLQDSTQTEEKLYLETMGTGVAWLDYDQDGLMDLYFVQSGPTDAYKPEKPLRSALYHNNGDGTFTDVTEKAAVGGEGHYGQGVAVGDYDNDGYPDIYVTGYYRAILYHNNGDGTFTDVTKKAGVGDEGNWSTSAAW